MKNNKKRDVSYPKVLVAAPIYDGKDYSFKKWYASILKLDYPNYDILVVDNSKGLDYTRKLRRLGLKTIHVHRGKNSREAVARATEVIRQYAIKHEYDYWLSSETDIPVPKDIIQLLMRHFKPVVGVMYEIGYPDSKNQPLRPCIFIKKVNQVGELYTANLNPTEGYAWFGTGLRQVHGLGLGCVLIDVSVLKATGRFWWVESMIKHPDVFFYKDLDNLGIPAYVDTNIFLKHYNSKWDYVKDI